MKDYTRWRLADLRDLRADIGEFTGLQNAVVAPDGSAIAWTDQRNSTGEVVAGMGAMICIDQLVAEQLTCTEPPREPPLAFLSDVTGLTWAGDSQSLFFTENARLKQDESDIWQLAPGTNTFTDRTDDQLLGSLLRRQPGDPPVPLDFMPFWNPANHTLYFFRSVFSDDEDRRETLELYRLTETGPEQVRDLTEDLPIRSIYVSPPAFSPDGNLLAFVIQPLDRDFSPVGVWLLDLSTGELKHAATLEALRGSAETEWQGQQLSAMGPVDLAWAGDNGIAVLVANTVRGPEAQLPSFVVYLNISTSEVIRLDDLSQFTSAETAAEQDANGLTAADKLPRRGFVSADGATFFYTHPGGLSALPLPPDGRPPALVSPLDTLPPGALIWSVGRDHQMGQWLIELSADGYVVLDGYLLHLVAD